MSQISVQSILIKYFFPRDVENFTQKGNRRNASNRRIISTSHLKQQDETIPVQPWTGPVGSRK